MTLTSRGIQGSKNIRRGDDAVKKARILAQAAILDKSGQKNKTRLLLDTYLRSRYLYNAILIPSLTELKHLDKSATKSFLRVLLKSMERGITERVIEKMMVLLNITPMT